ncbi:unnamed protein product [Clonostachys rhizophaga]|uniref:Zn(2)-C6 fungal-type domain-containing protein n=1 Tax=Clonostachys rhizophaga TaxID=160324 RepID=A0A9N9VKJ3_9HYPO|nr:unnamed protein product [Clonostachys rhizophaga]
MEDQPVWPGPQKRRRVERGPRSRNGCRTCIIKKVKCDEQRPACERCIRLMLSCEWTLSKPSLASRRLGVGPIKRRGHWKPQEILPKELENGEQQIDEIRAHHRHTPSHFIDSPPREELSNHDAVALVTASNDPSSTDDEVNLPLFSIDLWRSDQFLDDSTLHIDPSLLVTNSDLTLFPVLTTDILFSTTSLSFTSPLDPAPSIGCNDSQAVTFHRTILAPMKSTRVPSLSAHALFLDLAAHNRMALHFLLAFSYSELAIHHGFGHDPPVESYRHFQQGSCLFAQAIGPSNHVAMMISLLYLYMFWMRRDPLDVAKLRELSNFILIYVKTFRLDDICADASNSTQSEPVLISRIMTYIYDRDVFCGFFGSNMAFAGFVSENHEKRGRIWQLSRSPLSSLNDHESSDFSKNQHSMILDAYFTLITIQHEINCYSQGSETQTLGMKLRIQQRLDQVRQEHSPLFALAAANCAQGASPLMGLVTLTFFHALEIYLYRSRDSALGQVPTPARVQAALSQLVTAAYYSMAAGPVQLLERFQWALLIAGIETQDPVHRDWLSASISDPAIRGVYHAVQAAKGPTGISMRAIREVVARGDFEYQ